ncbi:riboflavin biosynthesis protein RibF [Granulicatella sp. zg-ZJ]|uniref:riboflavin biosynthesis protein RibF n=1 Tax=Granulicatella sp. zg-ZJ TaxID=2678504 RepID=UPI001F081E6D|nr:riboflavin biosynthesis protein RibF [Granulicatella sp. zg-ZJ]
MMNIIKLTYPFQPVEVEKEGIVLVLGFFDGVHLGHQKVIETGRDIAREKGYKLAVLSFNQHPSVIFTKQKEVYLTSVEEKAVLLQQMGVDIFYLVSFTEAFASIEPHQFIQDYVINLNTKYVVAGFDYRYGKSANGTIETLAEHSQGTFDVIIVEQQTQDYEKVSSTAIRQALSTGNIEKANALLGRVYATSGYVIHGDARGRQIGFPTANIKVDEKQYRLAEGVYIVRIKVKDVWYKGMASIGRNITFEQNRVVSVEVHVLDFSEDIYDEEVTIEWLKYVREEIKFHSVKSLIAELRMDEISAREYFESRGQI